MTECSRAYRSASTSSFLTDEEIKRLFLLFVPEAKASTPLKLMIVRIKDSINDKWHEMEEKDEELRRDFDFYYRAINLMLKHKDKYKQDKDIQKWYKEGQLSRKEVQSILKKVKAVVDRNDTSAISAYL